MPAPGPTGKFPQGFLWGVATAAHQVEGGNRHNDWWEAEQRGKVPYRSGDACDHYRLYEADFDLLQAWGHNCHRFSIEWSRVEPEEGQWDSDAIEHYRQVIRALRIRNIEPVVTLHHFSNPAWFSRGGGWLRSDAARVFERYVVRVVEAFGSEVRFWITINEPTVYVLQGYVNGIWPPFEQGKRLKAARVLVALTTAHRKAYRAIKSRRPHAMVGFAHNALQVEPCNAGRATDRVAARLRSYLLNGLIFRLIGASFDFIGLNYYTRCCVRAGRRGMSLVLGRACTTEHHRHQGAKNAVGWEIYPRGLGIVLAEFARIGVPLFITENGVATDDDRLRCSFLDDHLQQVASAAHDGIKLLGYLHWTLMDNFEWHLGTGPRFGLVAVDPQTGARKSRPSAELFARICRGDTTRGGNR